MADQVNCSTCKGTGVINALVNQHDDKTETVRCPTCDGKGEIHIMTDKDESDYWADYW
jgi:DnaJ-class molecular chaperone